MDTLFIPKQEKPWSLDICPGYVVGQPQIYSEAVTAVDAYRQGQLDIYFPGLENTILEAAQALSSAYSSYEVDSMKKPQGER